MKVYAGDYSLFYNPSVYEKEPWYINDHCIVRGEEGWHLFGITHKEPADPLNETLCAHALGQSLSDRTWKKLPYPIVADPTHGEAHFWAPHVIHHDGLYYMYWCAGSPIDHEHYQLMVATSPDLHTWTRVDEANPIMIDGFDARDPMVLRVGDRWILYYTATATPAGGNYLVACLESTDLLHWGNKRIVFTDPTSGAIGGPCESPFVVPYNGKYYLFIGPRDGIYSKTSVFESDDPLAFSIAHKVGDLPAHAAEVVRDDDGQYYTTRAGWGEGGVYIAPLYFEE